MFNRLFNFALLASAASALDQIDPKAPASYFFDAPSKYVFALSAIKQTGDIFVHMSAPHYAQWFGAGFGTSMTDSFMFVSYVSSNGSGVITSPRYATGHTEPTLVEEAKITNIYSDAYGPNSNRVNPHGIGIAHFICHNCTQYIRDWDWQNPAQPMFFAVGQNIPMATDDFAAPLSIHAYHGQFTMDLRRAVEYMGTYGRVPAPNNGTTDAIDSGTTFVTSGASATENADFDNDRMPGLHGVMMIVAFAVVFPAGALALRFFESVRLHYITQIIGILMVAVGLGTAIWCSQEYNRYNQYNDPHQRIGFALMALLLIQVGTGLTHHLIFRRHTKSAESFPDKKPKAPNTGHLNVVHMILGPFTLLLALINGGLGLRLAGNTAMVVPYSVVISVLVVIILGIRAWGAYFSLHKRYEPDPETLEVYMKTPTFGQFPTQAHYPEQEVPMTPGPYNRGPVVYTPADGNRPRAPWDSPATPNAESPYSARSNSYGFGAGKTPSIAESIDKSQDLRAQQSFSPLLPRAPTQDETRPQATPARPQLAQRMASLRTGNR